MTTKSPRRSPNCRINTTSRPTFKTRGLRNYTNHHPNRPSPKPHPLSIPRPSPLRNPNNQLYLLTPNRLKSTHRLLLCKPHRLSHRRNNNPNPLVILRSNNPNNLSRADILDTILPSKHKLRTHTQPHPPTNTRPTTHPPPHGNLMTISQLNQHSTTTNNKPNSRTNNHNYPI